MVSLLQFSFLFFFHKAILLLVCIEKILIPVFYYGHLQRIWTPNDWLILNGFSWTKTTSLLNRIIPKYEPLSNMKLNILIINDGKKSNLQAANIWNKKCFNLRKIEPKFTKVNILALQCVFRIPKPSSFQEDVVYNW